MFRRSRPAVRVGQDLLVAEGDSIREAVVVFGSATIDGVVERDLVVVLGSLRLGPNAVIHGSLVSVGSETDIAPGASVGRDLVVIGGGLDAPAGFSAGGEHVVIGTAGVARGVRAVVPWLTSGLLIGRLIVPGLPWMWVVVSVFFLMYLAINLLFDPPIRTVTGVLASRPLSTFLIGLLVLLLAGPVSVILAVSVVGLVVVPFLLCALVIAVLLGKVAVSRWVGSTFVPEGEGSTRALATRSFVIGSLAILLTYMIPVLGILVWSLTGVFALGAATMAMTSGWRRENPKRRAIPPVPVTPPVATTPAASVPHGASMMSSYPASEPVVTSGVPGPEPVWTAAPAAPDEVPFVAAGVPPVAPPPAPAFVPPSVDAAVAAGYSGVFPRAVFIDRAAAFALDFLLVLIFYNVIDFHWNGPGLFLEILLAYHIGAWTWKGTTVGGIICQLRVVRIDGSPLRFVDALVRGLSSVFSLAVAGLGCFWILRDSERQAWHDKIAGTYVVKVPRHYPV